MSSFVRKTAEMLANSTSVELDILEEHLPHIREAIEAARAGHQSAEIARVLERVLAESDGKEPAR